MLIEITHNKRHLSVKRGFMLITENKKEIARRAVDDISAVIANAHGLTYSNNLLLRLAEYNIPFILCGNNHMPQLWTRKLSPQNP